MVAPFDVRLTKLKQPDDQDRDGCSAQTLHRSTIGAKTRTRACEAPLTGSQRTITQHASYDPKHQNLRSTSGRRPEVWTTPQIERWPAKGSKKVDTDVRSIRRLKVKTTLSAVPPASAVEWMGMTAVWCKFRGDRHPPGRKHRRMPYAGAVPSTLRSCQTTPFSTPERSQILHAYSR